MTIAAHAHLSQGDLTASAEAISEGRSIVGLCPVGKVNAHLHWVAGKLALAEHRHWEAWGQLRQVASHPVIAAWAVADLAEAAAWTGKQAEFLVTLQRVEEDNEVFGSPHLALLIELSRGLVADGEAAGEAYRRAVDHGLHSEAHLETARTQLVYGEWLRRLRRVSEAREPLAQALLTFEQCGARLYARRATAELRATGVVSGPAPVADRPAAVAVLTAQELQIAQLAAEGMTNREIADRIYLSHRTVGSHLYKIFPKLGITSRAHLRTAIGA